MPAAGRGGSRTAAKPKAKPPVATFRSAPSGVARAHATLTPKHILMIASGVLTAVLAATLATGGRAAQIADVVGSGVEAHLADAGFKLTKVRIEGASRLATPDILAAAKIGKDQPLMGLDLNALKARIEAVGWVEEARVSRMLPDTVMIAVVERRQLAVWQHGGRSVVIDDRGQVIPEADPARFTRLPLVVGGGGAAHAGEILPLIAQRPQLMERLEALVRVDDRRWDLRLKDGALIQLPAVDAEQALIRLEQLELRSHVLALGFERIDLRNPDTVAVRPRPAPETTAPTTLVANGV